MSVDPYMRGRMNDRKSYAPPFQLGEALYGGAVGEVVAANADGFEPGDTVLHQLGWREISVVEARQARKVDASLAPASAYLGVLGMPGLTAYVGLLDIAQLREGDVVFVSGAAGAVGSLAGQIAKLRGHTVIGSAGSPEKVAYVRDELGFDAAFDYHDGPVHKQLRAAAPDGIDVYFDNVGGDHLEAAIGSLNTHGRVAMCGSISTYNATEAVPGPRNMFEVVGRRAEPARLHHPRPLRPSRGVRAGGRRVGARRAREVPRDDRRRRRRSGAAGIHRPVARRQHRQDGRAAELAALTAASRECGSIVIDRPMAGFARKRSRSTARASSELF